MIFGGMHIKVCSMTQLPACDVHGPITEHAGVLSLHQRICSCELNVPACPVMGSCIMGSLSCIDVISHQHIMEDMLGWTWTEVEYCLDIVLAEVSVHTKVCFLAAKNVIMPATAFYLPSFFTWTRSNLDWSLWNTLIMRYSHILWNISH